MLEIDISQLGPRAAIAGTILMSLFLGGNSAVKILTQKPLQAVLPVITPTLTPEGVPTISPEQNTETGTNQNSLQEEIVYKYEYYDVPNSNTNTNSGNTTVSNGSIQTSNGGTAPILAPTAIVVRTPTNTTAPTAVPPTATSAPAPTTASATNNGSACMVTLFGVQYNITNLVNTHSGGNIFTCGTDMTTKYQGKHGTSVSQMTKYLPGGSGTTSGGSSSSGGSTTYNCTGKDDGWSEAQKKYCEKQKDHDDDD